MNAPTTITAAPEKIHGQMVAVMRDLGAVGKDKKNESQGFKYRGIDDVYNAINPILSKHGVFMGASIIGKSREERTNAKGTVLAFTCLRMRYRFVAEDGSYVETEAEGEGMDSGDKSSNKAMAVAHKYALLQAFCIPTQDLDDPDAHVHEVSAKPMPPAAPAKPVFQPNEDTEAGVRNWVDQNKAVISEATRLPDLYQWLDEHGESWSKPFSGSGLDRVKRKVPDIFEEIKAHYMAKMAEINKGGK